MKKLDMADALRDFPREEFRAKLKADLERRANMATAKAVEPLRATIPNLMPYLIGTPADKLVEFMTRAFEGQELERALRPDGKILHTAVRIGDSVLEISDPPPGMDQRPMALHIYVPDADQVYRRAIEAGATSLAEPVDQPYGERGGGIKDLSGNFWYIATHTAGTGYVKPGFRTVTPYLHPRSSDGLIAFLKEAFEAEVLGRYANTEGQVLHAEVRIGDSIVEMGDANGPYQPMPATLHLHVADCDAVYERAVKAGAIAKYPLENRPYGERNGGVEDPFGHSWWIATRL